jgi:hypothetical protein
VKFGASGEYMVPRQKYKARSGPSHGTVPDATAPVLVRKDIGGGISGKHMSSSVNALRNAPSCSAIAKMTRSDAPLPVAI